MTLNKLINHGLLIIYGPIVSFVVLCGLVSNWFTENILKVDKPDIIITIAVIAAVMIGWIWWSFKIVKWKYWAFSQIRIEDRYKLYQKAIEVGLIWHTGSIFNRTEIWTKKDKENWKNLKPEIQKLFEI